MGKKLTYKDVYVGQTVYYKGLSRQIICIDDSNKPICLNRVKNRGYDWLEFSEFSITPPKEKEKRKMRVWINAYSDMECDSIFRNNAFADNFAAKNDRLACIEHEIEYEVEV